MKKEKEKVKGTGKNRREENRWDEKEREEEEGKPLLSFAVSTRSRGRVVRNIRLVYSATWPHFVCLQICNY